MRGITETNNSCCCTSRSTRSPEAVKHRAFTAGRLKKANIIKGHWTDKEDRLLLRLMQKYGVKKWSHIAQMLPNRVGKQCRERWHNHLRPNIKKDIWIEEEDRKLLQAHTDLGNRWVEIAEPKTQSRTTGMLRSGDKAPAERQEETSTPPQRPREAQLCTTA